MSTRELKLAAVYSEGKIFEAYDAANSAWVRIPGFLDFTESGGERDSRSTGTDSDRPHGVVSNLKAPTVECTFNYVSSPVWDILDDALTNKTVMSFRMTTEEEEIYPNLTGNTCAVADTGVCTFVTAAGNVAPGIDDAPIGADVKIGSAQYGILNFNPTGSVVTVEAPASAVSAAAYSIVTPAQRVSFRGKVTITPTRQHNLAQQSERQGTLMIQSLSVLPAPVRVIT